MNPSIAKAAEDFIQFFSHNTREERELEIPRQAGGVNLGQPSPTSKLPADEGWKVLPPSLHRVFYTSLRISFPLPGKSQLPLVVKQVPAPSQPQDSYAARCRRASRNRPQSIIVKTHLLGLAGCFIKEKIKNVLQLVNHSEPSSLIRDTCSSLPAPPPTNEA